ncbi:hypothetical protein SNEBB_011011 [Seison nebaliae]|nr:hypothetical protein SNEBB_011011 [Seison nebaliae]
MSNHPKVTCVAPVNIAVIKYWGKRCEHLILPSNPSLSLTLNVNELCARTTIEENFTSKSDEFILNDVKTEINHRMRTVIDQIRYKKEEGDQEKIFLKITSSNNFPTAAGLASSAAGFACLVYSLAKFFNYSGELSVIARRGSGSACRSIYGGFVEWKMGKEESGEDSYAQQLAPLTHWEDMRILLLVVSTEKKTIGSTPGMKRSIETSEFMRDVRLEQVKRRNEQMKEAIREKNFTKFAKLTMKDSNSFHAICLDSFPPINYLNDISHHIQSLVHHFNRLSLATKVAYTFDAGSNACLFLEQSTMSEFLYVLTHFYCHPLVHYADQIDKEFIKGIHYPLKETDIVKRIPLEQLNNGKVKYIISTKIGDGPKCASVQ